MRFFDHFVWQVLLLVLGGSALGLGINAGSRHPIRLGEPVYPASASGSAQCGTHAAIVGRHLTMSQREAVASCAACTSGFVDARGAHAFAEGHIPGAIHLPPAGHGDERAALDSLRKFSDVVVYDEGADCDFAPGVADRLQSEGFQVRILDGGWSGWQGAGGPAQSGACQACAGATQSRATP